MAEKTMGLPQNKCGPASIKTNSGGIAVDLDMNSPGDQLLMDISECGGTHSQEGLGIGGGTGLGKPAEDGWKDPSKDDYNKDWFSNFGDGGFHTPFAWEANFGILPPIGYHGGGGLIPPPGKDTKGDPTIHPHAELMKRAAADLLNMLSAVDIPGFDASPLLFLLQEFAGFAADHLSEGQNDLVRDKLSSIAEWLAVIKGMQMIGIDTYKAGVNQYFIAQLLMVLGLAEGVAGVVAALLAPIASEVLALIGLVLFAYAVAVVAVKSLDILRGQIDLALSQIRQLLSRMHGMTLEYLNEIMNGIEGLGWRLGYH